MYQLETLIFLLSICSAFEFRYGFQLTPGNQAQHQIIAEGPLASVKLAPSNIGPNAQPTQPLQVRRMPILTKSYQRDPERSLRLNLGDMRNRYVRLETMVDTLERISYALSKPASVIDAIRLFALAISSVLVATLNVS